MAMAKWADERSDAFLFQTPDEYVLPNLNGTMRWSKDAIKPVSLRSHLKEREYGYLPL